MTKKIIHCIASSKIRKKKRGEEEMLAFNILLNTSTLANMWQKANECFFVDKSCGYKISKIFKYSTELQSTVHYKYFK